MAVLDADLLVPWPAHKLGEALQSLGVIFGESLNHADSSMLLVGDANRDGLRIVHGSWCAELVPADWPITLHGPSTLALAGVLGAGLAIAELFMKTCGVHRAACERPRGLSLWRPELDLDHPDAQGPELAYLPAELWVMGLGHLGQAVLWSWAMLPFSEPGATTILLQDFDRAVPGNFGPQILMEESDVPKRKTRICAEFLRARGFDPAIVDRPVDEQTRRNASEPVLGIAAFDGQGPRWLLDNVGFDAAVVMGVGGTVADFDDIQIHTLPLPNSNATMIWRPGQESGNPEKLASLNPYYTAIRKRYRCGDLELAGVSVAVPFVGAIAGALAVSELLRQLAGGPQYSFHGLEVRSGDLGRHRRREEKDILRPRLTVEFQSAVPANQNTS